MVLPQPGFQRAPSAQIDLGDAYNGVFGNPKRGQVIECPDPDYRKDQIIGKLRTQGRL
jgi:hypothetical protein